MNPPASAGDEGSIPGSGRSPGEGNGNPLQYSCLGSPMDRAWWATLHKGRSQKNQTRLSDENNETTLTRRHPQRDTSLSLLGLELANRPKQYSQEHPLGPTSRNTGAPWQSCVFIVNFLPFLQIRRLLKKKKDPDTKVFFFFFCISPPCVQKCQEGWECKGSRGKTGNNVLSAPHPGTQLYHSLLCIVLQFLILRLMGRTVTAVLTTFCVQMVNMSLPGQLRSQPAGLGAGGGRGLGWRRSRGLGDPQRPSAARLWVSVQRPQERPLQAACLTEGWPLALCPGPHRQGS